MRRSPGHRSRPVLEDIEPRILMSADHPLAAAVASGAQAVQVVDQAPAPAAQQGVELVFIDHRVDDRDLLLRGMQADATAQGRRIEVLLLEADDDAVSRVGDALASRQGVAAVHLVGHGEAGRMLLGNGALDRDTVLVRAADIAAWGHALAQDADLLLYGCDLAGDGDGRALVDDLAQLTGADVAASTDRTGAPALGGNWTLEMQTGAIAAQLAFGLQTQALWQGVLATYTVTTTADSGAGSLRAAIASANGNAGTDTINFNIAGSGVHTITLATALPTITGTVLIDGTTDTASVTANGGRPAIVLDGNGRNVDGLFLSSTADGSTIRGLVIRNFGGAAIRIDSGSDGNTVAGNYLGAVTAAGTLGAAANGSYTVLIEGADNTIGGSAAADRNVLGTSGSGGVYGLLVSGSTANGNQILGNYIGIGADGSTAFSGVQSGIVVFDGASNRIEGNVIATNSDDGLFLSTTGAGTVVHNNLIGTNAAGTALAGAPNNGLSADAAGAGTVFSNNVIAGVAQSGIVIGASASGVTVQGNRIGTDAAGTANWGAQRDGIQIGGNNHVIGGTGIGQGNIVANSNRAATTYDGIAVSAGTGNAILGNSVYGTAAGTSGLGIDLGTSGATANDVGDADTGANNLQNFPVLTLAATDGAGFLALGGTLNSSANSYYRIELFTSPSGATNNGEGRTYLGFVNVSTDAAGNARFSTTLSATVPVGAFITATATRSNASFSTFTDTSEFSARLATAAVLTVDTTADNLGGTTSSVSALLASKGPDGLISLREAITAINNTAAGAQPTFIRFNIAGSGVHTITLASELPDITKPLVIDGTTDAASFAANGNRPAIVLKGNGSGGLWVGLDLTSGSGGSTVRGLLIQDFNVGIIVQSSSAGNTIAGNYIGQLGADGTLGGSATNTYGLVVRSANNTIGGTSAADRNVISGNTGSNVTLDNAAATGNRIVGNYLGTNAAGAVTGGGGFSGAWFTTGASNNQVGGTAAGEANLVAGNTARGVHVDTTAGTGNAILGNSIHSNGGLGIDLGTVDVTANDAGDTDTGPNSLQNFPVLTAAGTDGTGQVVVAGTLSTNTGTNYYRVEFFASPTGDASGNGEGQIYLGFANVPTTGGTGSFSTTLAAVVPVGYAISATATRSDATYTTFTDTSEFSAYLLAAASNEIAVTTAADNNDSGITAGNATHTLSWLAANKGTDGLVSLREAIIAANNTPNGSGPDRIRFDIAGSGVHTITLGSLLPSITGAVRIDGTTDTASVAGNGGRPAIVINVNGLNGNGLTLTSTAGGSTLRGLHIYGQTIAGISIQAGSDGNTIVGNYLGALDSNGQQATVTTATYQVLVNGANNVIGGSTAADRNVIAGNGGLFGVMLFGAGATGNVVKGNYIGTNAAGTTANSLSVNAVTIQSGAANNTIGGGGVGDGNVIATANNTPVYITTSGTGNVVQGNRIGVSATGALLGGHSNGIRVDQGVVTLLDNWIGGGSQHGIWLNTPGGTATVQGNRIGTDLAGTANWGPSRSGIQADTGGHLIGGTGAGQGNTVANSNQAASTFDGIAVSSGTGNAILGNSVYGTVAGTSGRGIDLGASGLTANDAGDTDTGANNLQNFPVLTVARTDGTAQVFIAGTLSTNTGTNFYRVEFFASPTGAASGYGEGQTYLGFVNVPTTGGTGSFSATLSAAVPLGYAISATATRATDGTYSAFTDTSEFSANLLATASNEIAVTTAADNNDSGITAGNGTHTLNWLAANKGTDGLVSLREAIIAANNTPNGSGPDRITFAIAGTGVHTITLASALPAITGAVVIDGSTDDSFAANGSRPAIILDGNSLNADGLVLASGSGGSTIRGLVIGNFDLEGIQIDSGSDGNTIAGNYIGSLAATGNSGGVGNGGSGIYVLGTNNTIGGTTAADRNLIAGNANGVVIGGGSGNQVVGNYIGTNLAGTTVIANIFDGVRIETGGTGNTVGGSNTNQRNVIAGNGGDGVQIDGEASDGNTVRGNWIGVGADGATLLGTGGVGIFVSTGADNTVVGGPGANDGNWIARASLTGIEIDGTSTGTLIQGNRIGTDLAGTANWGVQQNGILIENSGGGGGPSSNLVADNIVAFSGQGNTFTSAISLLNTAGNGNTLLRNLVYSSVGLGIDLGATGIATNDAGDSDTGANNLQNYPVLTVARTDGTAQVFVAGTLGTNTGTNFYRIEFFASPTGDASGNGEGQIYLGFVNVSTTGGTGSFSATLSAAVPLGYAISATATRATDGTYSAFTDTSEFSAYLLATASNEIAVTTAADNNDSGITAGNATHTLYWLAANKGTDGLVSLREAIIAANNTTNGSGPDRITFAIAGTGVHTITLASALPAITGAVVIDGSTDDSFAANGSRPAIVLDGNGLTGDGLVLASGSGGSTIRGLVIRNFGLDGIQIDAGSNGNTIAGNYIGSFNADGSAGGLGNVQDGIYVQSNNNIIGGATAADRNVISGNLDNGIQLRAASGNQILGNYIGTNATASNPLGNDLSGIRLSNNSSNNVIGTATAGNLIAASRGMASGNRAAAATSIRATASAPIWPVPPTGART
jgi:hypothetical protein